MPKPSNKWYVITGGPATGKSTLLEELGKLGHNTLPEAARQVIDEGLAMGKTLQDIRSDKRNFQKVVLQHKIITEKKHPRDKLTFFDRGMHDTLAYLRLDNIELWDEVHEALKNATYKKVFLLEPLDDYNLDYARTETKEEAQRLNRLLHDAFSEYGMKPVLVPPLSPKERARFVLQHVPETPTL